jgi:hypothetical protein
MAAFQLEMPELQQAQSARSTEMRQRDMRGKEDELVRSERSGGNALHVAQVVVDVVCLAAVRPHEAAAGTQAGPTIEQCSL